MKKILKFVLIGVMLFSNVFSSEYVYAAEPIVYYNQVSTQNITKGVEYERSHRITSEGWLDVNVLRVKLGDENISVQPVQSTKEMGYKETLLNILKSNNAVAGVNGDFFGLSGNYSVPFGVVVKDGKLINASIDNNQSSNDYASFYLDNSGNPFINYFTTTFEFLNDGKKNIEVSTVNKAGNYIYNSIKVDREFGNDTSSLDSRFQNLVKLVVKNNVLEYISLKGETVQIPEDGYVIVMNDALYDEKALLFWAGQTAEFKVYSSIDLQNVSSAISGGALLVRNGIALTPNSIAVSPAKRLARSAVGITEDNKELIIMSVDINNQSIGATHMELANLMKEYGAYTAMNLDGGGSTTMIADTIEDDGLTIKNNLTVSGQRKIINGLGIYNNSQVGELKQIVLNLSQKNVFKGTALEVEVFGYDEYYNRIEIPFEDIEFTVSDNAAVWSGQKFYPNTVGEQIIIARYNKIMTHAVINVREAVEIRTNISEIGLDIGDTADISFVGVDVDGFRAEVTSGAKIEVYPESLGYIEDGTFIAANNGNGYVKCTVNLAQAYIPVTVNSRKKSVTSFENLTASDIKYVSQPQTVVGLTDVTDKEKTEGSKSLMLTYLFGNSDETQAAYLEFQNPIQLDGEPIGIEISVHADASKHWLRGRIRDAAGKTYNIDFAKTIDWEGWKRVQAYFPQEIKYPVTLERIYPVVLSNEELNLHTLYFDNLKSIYPLAVEKGDVPQSSVYQDSKQTNLDKLNLDTYFDINILPKVTTESKPSNYAEIQSEIFAKFQENAVLGVFASEANVEETEGIIKYKSKYSINTYSNAAVIQLRTAGGLNEQWITVEEDMEKLDKDHYIIIMDKNPLNFSDSKQKQLFQDIMAKFVEKNKNIIIISSTGEETWATVQEGIRYINLGYLFKADGSLNDGFRMLRLRFSGARMYYDFKER